MNDLFELIYQAWRSRIKPLIDKDPDELARRLARRRNGMMRRPPRAWCLAVRAADQRINPATAVCVPEDAAYPHAALGERLRGYVQYDRHEVTLTAPLLRQICRPVTTPKPGVDARTLAAELGVPPAHLRYARRRGVFSVHFVKGYAGRFGNPVPFLYTDKLLDPSHQSFEQSDILWGTCWRYVADHVPPELRHTLVRVPVWWTRRQRSRAYGERIQERFSGWRWLCPSCGKTKRTLYFPLPPMLIVQLLPRDCAAERDPAHPDAQPAPLSTFACKLCHNILYFTRRDSRAWNHLIAHLSGGLVYGCEVPRPDWYKEQRKRPFRPVLTRAPSKRRQMVLADLLEGLSFTQIARRQGVSKGLVSCHAWVLCRQHRVKGVRELRAKLAGSGRAAHDAENLETQDRGANLEAQDTRDRQTASSNSHSSNPRAAA